MNDRSVFSMDREGRLAEVLDAYLAALEAGTSPDVEDLLARHPDLAGDLRECLSPKKTAIGPRGTSEGQRYRRPVAGHGLRRHGSSSEARR